MSVTRCVAVLRTPTSVGAVVLALLLVAPTPVEASSVGGPTGPAYDDAAACVVPWLAAGESTIIEGITVRATTNTSDYLGVGPEEGRYLHTAAADGSAPDTSTTVLTFDPALEAVEFTVTELVPGDPPPGEPPYASESYGVIGSPDAGSPVLAWTLTDEDVQVSGTFTPGIASLEIAYEPSVSPDGADYGAIIRLRVPRVGDTCEVEDTSPPRDRDRDEPADEGLPVPVAVPSGAEPSPAPSRANGAGSATVMALVLALLVLRGSAPRATRRPGSGAA